MPISHLCLDAKASSDNFPQPKEKMGSSVLEHAVKVRKPYTISKQRERWTEEEHSKFLEALKLYGRAWRQIEEHVCTKTAVQIRSHAQKFFTKVGRESAGDGSGEVKTIEIPPPRPKRKPARPYPRKLGNLPRIRVAEEQDWSLIQTLPVSEEGVTEQDNPLETQPPLHEQDNLSPTSVVSAVGSDTCGSSASELVNGCTSPDSSVVGLDPGGASLSEQENGCQSAATSVEDEDRLLALHDPNMELDLGSDDSVSGMERTPVEAPAACLKLFGKMVVMSDPQKPPCSPIGNAERCPEPYPTSKRCPEPYPTSTSLESHCESDGIGQQVRVHNQIAVDGAETLSFGEHMGQLNSWPMFYLLPSHAGLQNSAEAGAAPSPWMWAFYGGAPAAAAAQLSLNSEQGQLPSFRESLDTLSLSDGHRRTNAIRGQHCRLKLRPSETSAFRSLKAATRKPASGFAPYKRCVSERNVDSQRMTMTVVAVDDGGEGQGVRLCL